MQLTLKSATTGNTDMRSACRVTVASHIAGRIDLMVKLICCVTSPDLHIPPVRVTAGTHAGFHAIYGTTKVVSIRAVYRGGVYPSCQYRMLTLFSAYPPLPALSLADLFPPDQSGSFLIPRALTCSLQPWRATLLRSMPDTVHCGYQPPAYYWPTPDNQPRTMSQLTRVYPWSLRTLGCMTDHGSLTTALVPLVTRRATCARIRGGGEPYRPVGSRYPGEPTPPPARGSVDQSPLGIPHRGTFKHTPLTNTRVIYVTLGFNGKQPTTHRPAKRPGTTPVWPALPSARLRACT